MKSPLDPVRSSVAASEDAVSFRSQPDRPAGAAAAARRGWRRRARAAFTLLEMLMVIALIALLATVGIVALGNLFSQGQEGVAKTWVTSTAKTALWGYRMAVGRFPTTEEGLAALVRAPEGAGERWKGPYLETSKVPVDPWGKPYQYRYPGTKNPSSYDVFSLGPDGQEGTADDIGNWD